MKTATKQMLFKAVESVSPDHIHSYLVKYWKCKGKTMMEPRKMLFTAVSAFWLPFALRLCGKFSPTELREHAAIAIRQLQEQIHLLEMHFLVGDTTNSQSAAHPSQINVERHVISWVNDENEFKAIHMVQPDHIYSYLVKYWKCKGKTTLEPSQMLFAAISAFWLPFALRLCGKFSPTELREYAAIAIRQLEEQIHLLKIHFLLGETTEFTKSASNTADVEPDDAFQSDSDRGVDDSDLSDLFN